MPGKGRKTDEEKKQNTEKKQCDLVLSSAGLFSAIHQSLGITHIPHLDIKPHQLKGKPPDLEFSPIDPSNLTQFSRRLPLESFMMVPTRSSLVRLVFFSFWRKSRISSVVQLSNCDKILGDFRQPELIEPEDTLANGNRVVGNSFPLPPRDHLGDYNANTDFLYVIVRFFGSHNIRTVQFAQHFYANTFGATRRRTKDLPKYLQNA